MNRLVKYSIIIPLFLFLLIIFLTYLGANYPDARLLTDTEKELARSVYSDLLNVDLIRIVFDTPYSFDTSKTIGNTIHIKTSDYSHLESLKGKTLLIHEFGHVWQYQNAGWDYIPKSLIAQFLAFIRTGSVSAAYDWETGLHKKVAWEKFNPEQQTESIAAYFYYRELGNEADIRQQGLKRTLECFIPFLHDDFCERKLQWEIKPYTQANELIEIGTALETKYSKPQSKPTIPLHFFKENKEGSYYYSEIAKNRRVIFQLQNIENGNIFKGDIVLEQEKNNRTVLLQDTMIEVGVGGGGAFEVYPTNIPHIFVLQAMSGHGGVGTNIKHYLDLTKNEIVFTIKHTNIVGYTLIKKGFTPLDIGWTINDRCGEFSERVEGKAQIIDLKIDEKPVNALSGTREVACLTGATFVLYDPDFGFVDIGVESDFSKFYFSFRGVTYEKVVEEGFVSSRPVDIWRDNFAITFE